MKRKMTLEHQWLEIMCQRGGLHGKDLKRLENLRSGFSGEWWYVKFDQEFT